MDNRRMKMMLLANNRGGDQRRGNRSGYDNRYEYDNRQGGRGNRAEYDDDEGYEVEDRFRDRRGREHYDNGRFAPMRSNYPMEDNYMRGEHTRPVDPIGFSAEYYPNGPRMHSGEMRGSEMGYGYAGGKQMTQEVADEWVDSMRNADGTRGPHWTMQQVKQLIGQRRLDVDPVELYTALNATYSDLSKFFKKYNINNMDAYVDYAKMFWLEDEDAVEDKLAAYYTYVVK